MDAKLNKQDIDKASKRLERTISKHRQYFSDWRSERFEKSPEHQVKSTPRSERDLHDQRKTG